MKMKKLLFLTLLFFAAAAPAHAGPVIGAVALLGGWAAGTVTAAQAILGLVVSGASWLIGQMMLPKEKQRGVKTKMETGGDKPPAFIIGEYATAGALDYVNVWDGDSDGIPTDGNNVTGYTFLKNEFSNQITHTFKANAQYFHKCRVFPISPNDIEGTGSAYTTVGAQPGAPSAPAAPSGISFASKIFGFQIGWTQLTDPNYVRTDIAIGTSTTVGPSNDSAIISSITSRGVGANPVVWVYYPEDPALTRYIWIKHVNLSRQSSAWVFAGTFINPGVQDGYVASNSIDTDQIWVNAVNEAFSSATTADQVLTAGSKTLVESILCLHGSGANLVEIWTQFKNNSGASKTINISIEDGTGTSYRAFAAIVPDGGVLTPFARIVNPAGNSTNVKLFLTVAGGGTINNTVVFAQARRR